MGCGNSNLLPASETKESYKDIQNHLSTNNENPSKNENSDNNPVKHKIVIKENNENKLEYRNKINLTYYAKSTGIYEIFGEIFVLRNQNNIDLFINGKESELINVCELKEGDNIITLKIKNDLTYLSFMFSGCSSLKNIEELKYLDVRKAQHLEYMLSDCILLTDINPLRYWDVSNCQRFKGMFAGCRTLSNINPLANWNVSKGSDFAERFNGCTNLTSIIALTTWNVSNGTFFQICLEDVPH